MNMLMQRRREKPGQHKDAIVAGVQTITQRDVRKPVDDGQNDTGLGERDGFHALPLAEAPAAASG